MKSKTMILLGAAIVCGLVASYMTSKLLAERNQEQTVVVEEAPKTSYLVAKKNIPLGTLLAEPRDWFQEKWVTQGDEPKNAIRTFDEVKNQRVQRPLTVEGHLTREDLLDSSKAGLRAKMKPGTRGIAIRVNAETTGGGFVMPDDCVDVLATLNAETVTFTLLEDMRVLAVDSITYNDPNRQAYVGSTVTFEVDPDQAELLTMAQSVANLRLVLRPWEDHSKTKTGKGKGYQDVRKRLMGLPVTQEEDDANKTEGEKAMLLALKGGKKPAEAEVKQPEPPKPPPVFVQVIYNGTEVTKAVFPVAEKNAEPPADDTAADKPAETKDSLPKAGEPKPDKGAANDGSGISDAPKAEPSKDKVK